MTSLVHISPYWVGVDDSDEGSQIEIQQRSTLVTKGLIGSGIRRRRQMAANNGKHESCKGSRWVQRALLGDETKEVHKCHPVHGDKIPEKVKMAQDDI